MEFPLANLTNEDISKYQNLVREVINKDFPELKEKYQTIKILVFRQENVTSDVIMKEVNDFMGVPCEPLIRGVAPTLRNYAVPPKACLEINLSDFEKFQIWEQKYALRHEFTRALHMLIKGNPSKSIIRLRSKYDLTKIGYFIFIQHEVAVEFRMIEKWQEDWVKVQVREAPHLRFGRNPSSKVLYLRKLKGRKEAILFCLGKIVWYMALLKLYHSLSDDNKYLVKANKVSAKNTYNRLVMRLTYTQKTSLNQDIGLTMEIFFRKNYFSKELKSS